MTSVTDNMADRLSCVPFVVVVPVLISTIGGAVPG